MCLTSNSNYYEVRSRLNNVVYTTMRVETVASPVTALQIQIVRINMAIPRTVMIRGISVKSMRHFSFVLLISVSRVADSICEEDDADDRMFLLSIFDPQFRRVRAGRTAGVARSIGLYSCSSFIGFFVVSNSADKVGYQLQLSLEYCTSNKSLVFPYRQQVKWAPPKEFCVRSYMGPN